MKTVEVLHFDGCPNTEAAVSNARLAIARAGAQAEVRLVRMTGDIDALERRFIGSPTVRVDGLDVEASGRERTDFGLQCRVYSSGGRFTGAPPVEWIEAALRGEPGVTAENCETREACTRCSPRSR